VAQPLTVAFPPDLTLTDGWLVTIAAVDPVTGADVSGVTITEALMQVEVLEGAGGAALNSGPFMFVPGPGA
jgi:hypothetical protein